MSRGARDEMELPRIGEGQAGSRVVASGGGAMCHRFLKNTLAQVPYTIDKTELLWL